MGCPLWGRTESNTTEVTEQQQQQHGGEKKKKRNFMKIPRCWERLRHEEKGTTENEMVGWHHPLDGLEFEQALEVGDGQGSLVCCSSWGHGVSDMTE